MPIGRSPTLVRQRPFGIRLVVSNLSRRAIVGRGLDGLLRIRKLDRGGSARLLPLVSADGLAEIGPGTGHVSPDGLLIFHPFSTSFALRGVFLDGHGFGARRALTAMRNISPSTRW